MVKTSILFLLFSMGVGITYSQVPAYFRITFTDKHNSPYTLDNPADFLSQRALDRRTTQSIKLSENDLPVNPQYIENTLKTGAIYINKSKWFNSIIVIINDSLILEDLKTMPYIKSVERVSKVFSKEIEMPDITTPSNSTHTSILFNQSVPVQQNPYNVYQYNYGKSHYQTKMLSGDYLHENGFNGNGMLIAVFDVGFMKVSTLKAFDSLRNDNRIICTKDMTTPNGDVFSNGTHGLYVLSILAANKPSEYIGSAPNANYILLRTEFNSTENLVEEDSWAAGAEFADSCGVDIISSSLGYTTFDDSTHSHTYNDMDGHTTRVTNAARIASEKGILVINSAGNSGNKPWHFISAPSDADSVLTVGATDSALQPAYFSSFGPTADGRIKPDVCALGYATALITYRDSVDVGNGTSFSTPIISGLAACLWQMFPNKNNIEIKQAIIASTNQQANNCTGFGVPNFYRAARILEGYQSMNKTFSALISHKSIHLFILSNTDDVLHLNVYNTTSELLESTQLYCKKGYNYISIKTNTILANGVYILKAYSNNVSVVTKAIKGVTQ